MTDIQKWINIAIADVVKIMNIDKADLSKFMGLDIPIIGDRGIFGGGAMSRNTIDYITISSAGPATDFGDLTVARYGPGATSNGTNERGIFGGGHDANPIWTNIIDYITISAPGNATDFGDLTVRRRDLAATSNGTSDRGIFGGGYGDAGGYNNTIDYITISSAGDATDFGDLTVARHGLAATSNGTNDRGIFGGGDPFGAFVINTIDYVTISSAGSATDFGDLTITRRQLTATSNGINDRGIFGGGWSIDPYKNESTIDYITISSTGNATDFGDLTVARYSPGATSNGTSDRGVFGGGWSTAYENTIDYITISSAGDATDFGDLTVARSALAATSNA